jgi:dephospho-CoA kinase
LLIGLTGGIASGKSKISLFLKSQGAIIIDADDIARHVVEPLSSAWKKIVDLWGKDVLRSDQSLDRQKLASIVFSNKDELEKLNNITHPEIIREIKERISMAPSGSLIVLDAPLLIEAGLFEIVDYVWLVSVTEVTQIKRLMERDGLSTEEAQKRIAVQMPLEEKKKYAHVIIDNNGQWEDTENFIRLSLLKKGGQVFY